MAGSAGVRGRACQAHRGGHWPIAAVAVIAITPLAGYLPDRSGRRPSLLALALFFAVVPPGLFALGILQ